MICIVGSGPAGIATALPLVQRGLPVTLIDGGMQLEPSTQETLRSFKEADKKDWDLKKLQAFRSQTTFDARGVQLKRLFGSDFPYRGVETYLPQRVENVGHFTPSLAQGGFSTVWGSAVLPYDANDLQGWPITFEDLKPHYQALLSYMQLRAEKDDLEPHFPILTTTPCSLRPSRQAQNLFERFSKNREYLNAQGIWFGKSRLALQSAAASSPCVYCGNCLYGCPKDLIFSTLPLLKKLKTFSNFTYKQGYLVNEVQPTRDKDRSSHPFSVRVSGLHLETKAPFHETYQQVFLAAGVLSTARIILKSLNRFNEVITVPVSEYFMQPLLARQNTAEISKEELFTLSQLFLEVKDPKLSNHWMHLQLYTYNDMFAEAFKQKLKSAGPLFPFFDRHLTGRLMLIQGYLHSHDSSHLELSLNTSGELLLKGVPNKKAHQTVRKLVKKLLKNSKSLGFWPLLPMLNIGLPGEGRHVGGTFPMSDSPVGLQTNFLGELQSLPGVKIVDASVFPSVPAPTITFTAMANAHRIANQYIDSQEKNP